MMRKVFFSLAVGFFCAICGMAAEDRAIRITDPDGDALEFHVRNEILQIRWTHGAYFDSHAENCRVLCGDRVISPELPVTVGAFAWTVGRKSDGAYLEPGDYGLSIRTASGDGDLNGPWFRYATSAPEMTFAAPAENEYILLGSLYPIRWTHSSFFAEFPEHGNLEFADWNARVRIADDRYEWPAGRKADGSYVGPGSYTFHFQPVDPWVAHKWFHVRLIRLSLKPRIPLKLVPFAGRPFHYHLDPGQLGVEMGGLEFVEVDLLHGRDVAARLGRFGPRLAAPGLVNVVLQKASSRPLSKQGFELQVRAPNGKVLLRQAVAVEIVK